MLQSLPLRLVSWKHFCWKEHHVLNRLAGAFRSLLPSWYEFVFIDGGIKCNPAPGVEDFYSEPYLCWYNTPTTAKVTEAHRRVSAIIENDGPFDAVMGFSQVCATISPIISSLSLFYSMSYQI